MSDEKQLPKHIGGYQHINNCEIKEGDIWVRDGEPFSFVDESMVGIHTSYPYEGFSIYRKMDCPKQGGHRDIIEEAAKIMVDDIRPILKAQKDGKAATYDDGKAPLSTLPY